MKVLIRDCGSLLEWSRRTIGKAYNLPTLEDAIYEVSRAVAKYSEKMKVEVEI